MLYPSIYTSGNLISQELIDKLDDDSYLGQRPSDFGLESGIRTRQDIARAWTDANDYWKIFKRKLDALKDTERGTTETRNQWMIPLLGLLSYDLNYIQQAETVNDKSYDVSHRATNRDALPVLIVSAKDGLDIKPEGITRYRMSPHALLQEYLNVTEHTYGLVTNGKLLRLLRDNGRVTRLTYLEFNLEKIFEEDLYADFALLYRLLHISRMPQSQGQVADSIIEKYYQQAIEAGTRIRNSLNTAVEEAIKVLANGLLKHPANGDLRQQLQASQLSSLDFYQAQLRLVYRLLFVMTIEERRLVYPENLPTEQQSLSNIYYSHYSLQRLRNLAGKKHLVQGRHHNLYIQLWHNFQLLEQQRYAEKLGMQALGSGLFEPGRLQPLDSCKMYNKDLLQALWHLSYFTDEESGQTIRVNYGALNVEEFGSVYEGLLEYQAQVAEVNGQWQFVFVHSNERSKSGSHYTPEELVQPLIKHSLEYLIEDKLKENDPVDALLSLKICDVACGSGHILLSAARRIALEVARKQFNEEQPSPEHLRWATRQVINHCIYGVDKNPLAVELCKVALWLEAHNPGEPLNFLDHHIKCGDAIVGLAHREELDKGIADEAYKTLPEDDKDIASAFLKRNKQERKQQEQSSFDFDAEVSSEVLQIIEQYNLFKNLPERTPEDVAAKAKAHSNYEQDIHRIRLRQLADAQIAQFFIPKTDANKPYLITDAEYRGFLRQVNKHLGVLQSNKLVFDQESIAKPKRFFHWFLEFPEVFTEGGFDCILGNPPYLGGTLISGAFEKSYYEYLIAHYSGASNRCDLLAYFLRRIFSIIRPQGFLSLIATNSISEGDTRTGGLEKVLADDGVINYAARSIPWPGKAAVIISLISIFKGHYNKRIFLQNNLVAEINSFLEPGIVETPPLALIQNENIGYNGSYIFGDGFLLEPEFAKDLIKSNPENNKILFPYLNGDDLNSSYLLNASRWVINFGDRTIEESKKYEECFRIVDDRVKKFRQSKSKEVASAPWWQFWRLRKNLYQAIKKLDRVLIHTRVTKTHGFSFVPANMVFSDATVVIASNEAFMFSYLQSSVHEAWAWKYSSKLKSDRRYSVEDCFQTFPFAQNFLPSHRQQLEQVGEQYNEHRRQLMLTMRLGLTKTYNIFHAAEIQPDITTAALLGLEKKAIQNQGGKEVWILWNHLQKAPSTCLIEDVIALIIKLRELQVQIDNAVLDAYGWNDIPLEHNFYEVDYLPENDRIRYTIHPEARKEVLKRLLELNHQIHEEEVKKGLWDKKGKKKGIITGTKDSNSPELFS